MLWREEQGCGREGGEGEGKEKGKGQNALAVQQRRNCYGKHFYGSCVLTTSVITHGSLAYIVVILLL